MFPFSIEWKEDVRKMTMMRKRGFNKLFKKALKDAVIYWQSAFTADNFDRSAYDLYPEYSVVRKKPSPGRPLVTKGPRGGTLRRRMLRKTLRGRIGGTAKKVWIRIPFGRPPKYTGKWRGKQIGAVMAAEHISYKRAARKVNSMSTYSALNKMKFDLMITATTGTEEQMLAILIRNSIIKQAKRGRGTKTKRWKF